MDKSNAIQHNALACFPVVAGVRIGTSGPQKGSSGAAERNRPQKPMRAEGPGTELRLQDLDTDDHAPT